MQFKRVPRTDLKVGDKFKLMLGSAYTYVVLETNALTGKILYMDVVNGFKYHTYDMAYAYIVQAKIYPQRKS